MPYLNIKLSVPSSTETTSKVATMLTEFTGEYLKKKRELTSVAVEYINPNDWFIGGLSVASQGLPTIQLDIKITEGTNSKDEKATYIQKTFEALESLIGKLNPASYIVIHEVRGDSWGFQGATQEYRYINGKRM